ncbi:uncharacterized protein IUM83_07444 [Phytophthora cinnamomi]|uniref:uncharacterized protein n=2 Tax=Phytophthora cinnamomi TaxID=4785 RepID=UPI00355A1A52|nr:hypothetical protein IUM83_07444 [Phytophthora cinnamomi]
MEPHRFHINREDHSARYRFVGSVDQDEGNGCIDTVPETKTARRPGKALLAADLQSAPWLGWLCVYAFVLFCFSASRCLALRQLVMMYSSPRDYTWSVKLAALSLGFVEDLVCTTYFVCALWLFDVLKLEVGNRLGAEGGKRRWCMKSQSVGTVATFVVSWLLFFAMMTPFVADLLLVVNRDMRFTFDLVTMAINEKEFASAAPISTEEIHRGYVGAAVLVVVTTLFACVRVKASWSDLSVWNPTHVVASPEGTRTRTCNVKVASESASSGVKYVEVALEEGANRLDSPSNNDEDTDKLLSVNDTYQNVIYRHGPRVAIVLLGIVVVPVVAVALCCTCSPLVAYVGMNATLNELFGHIFQPTASKAMLTTMNGDQPWVEKYIHPTEMHELFGNDSLYRRTTGFQGDLAFDVKISKENPPNVLVIAVESFRYQDSRYLVGQEDPSNLFKGTNMTITPNFDRWAKRGVALRNMWSSTPTSRSLESLLFAQVPYDSTVKTGITGGRKDTKLSGLPQLFKAKKYGTYFTTGCPTRFENWDVFLPSHGFKVVLELKEMILYAENRLGIKRAEWFGDEKRAFKWGVHDDINLQLLGDMIVDKTKAQHDRVANGKPKKPLFITHYTISSHAPFKARPTWYADADKPDFSAIYQDEKHAEDIKDYLEMRYFTDMQLGKFMDRMEKEGILNDTIVVIVGDHGQAPEADVTNTHEEAVTRVAGAIIAEGRLGDAAGLVIEDAVEHYDILNTLADITGLPEGGNDPSRKMAIVRGHQRLRYDQPAARTRLRLSSAMELQHHRSAETQSARYRFVGSVDQDDEHGCIDTVPETKTARRPGKALLAADLQSAPWLGWLCVYAFVLFCFSASRCLALRQLVMMYSSPRDYTWSVKLAALSLGFVEDLVCTTYFVCALWLFDVLKLEVGNRLGAEGGKRRWCMKSQSVGTVATFVVSWLLFFAMMTPFVADLLLVVNRDMRFTFDLVTMAINEKEFASAAPISTEEIHRGYVGAAVLVVVTTLFACVRVKASWSDLSVWNPTHVVASPEGTRTRTCNVKVASESASSGVKYVEVALEEGANRLDSPSNNDEVTDKLSSVKEGPTKQKILYHHISRVVIILMGVVVAPSVAVSLRRACTPLVAYVGMNATLNELFGHAFQPASIDVKLIAGLYIHPTEKHELFGDDSLYRRTTGFQGDLAFDVKISKENPPNVLVIAVESFRYQDSRYLVGQEDPSNLFKGTNMTITPNFDRWAKRGVALRNMWSSTPTSRSLESLLFAQVPYDSTVKTGITGGRKDTKLSGLPQLFKAKEYETFFTTGCTTRFENWDVFLPTHGFETVLESNEIMALAESELGIPHGDWMNDEHRGFNWGVHDDISLQILGTVLVNKTSEQRERLSQGHAKKPLFITHYTISSHAPFKERPTWYANADKPDFSAIYQDEKHAEDIKDYLEMRYFTDMQLGKFMDRMEKEGILNDTIVVIVGDHGQAPEADVTNTHEEAVTRVAGAIIAEGRLGDAAGLVIEDAVEHYDILNTLADITGQPEGGNDPSRKMAIVRGHQRLRYDQVTASMLLHDTETDFAMNNDLFSNLTAEAQTEWKNWRLYGRRVTAYFKQRLDGNCLLAVDCTSGR